jgi:hypothetical protein
MAEEEEKRERQPRASPKELARSMLEYIRKKKAEREKAEKEKPFIDES